MSVEDVTEILAIRSCLGSFRMMSRLSLQPIRAKSVVQRSGCLAGTAYDNVCSRILGEEIPIPDYTKSEGILARMSHLFKRN